MEFFKNGPLSLRISDFLDMGNNTRNNNLFVPMDYFAKLMCNIIDKDKLIWGQKLVFPRSYNMITAGFKEESPGYWLEYSTGPALATHYGTDIGKYDLLPSGVLGIDTNLYALGVGTTIRNVWNDSMGNILQVLYKNVIMPDNTVKDIVALYAHLYEKPKYEKGDQVFISEEPIAIMGGTGKYGGGRVHLHLELIDYYEDIDNERKDNVYPTNSLGNSPPYFGDNGFLQSYSALDVLYRRNDSQQVVLPGYGLTGSLNQQPLMDYEKVKQKNNEAPLK